MEIEKTHQPILPASQHIKKFTFWLEVHDLSLQKEQSVPVPDDHAKGDEKAREEFERFLTWAGLGPLRLDGQVEPKADIEPIQNKRPERQVNNSAEAKRDTDPFDDDDSEYEGRLQPYKKLRGLEPGTFMSDH